jgi:PhoPQ-activated pathogenicity-related protein
MGLQEQLKTPRGQELSRMIDPYTYRERLTMPKLIINATNDPYWPLDAASLYQNDLKGPNNFLYVPNVGHTLANEELKVASATAAWVARIGSGQQTPTVTLKGDEAQANGERHFTITSTPAKVQLWVAQSASRDFRKAQWKPLPTSSNEAGIYNVTAPARTAGMKYTAAFAEISIEGDNPLLALRVTSPVEIWGGG